MDYGDVAKYALESYGPLWLRQRSHLGWYYLIKFQPNLILRLEMRKRVHFDHAIWILLLLLCVYVSKHHPSRL